MDNQTKTNTLPKYPTLQQLYNTDLGLVSTHTYYLASEVDEYIAALKKYCRERQYLELKASVKNNVNWKKLALRQSEELAAKDEKFRHIEDLVTANLTEHIITFVKSLASDKIGKENG